jgi:hypothetical protein
MIVLPDSYDSLVAQYGVGSTCWTSESEAQYCATACADALALYANQCVCTGPVCQSNCMDMYEPNNAIGSATAATTDTPGSFVSSSLKLCAGDVDVFAVPLTTTGRIVATVSWTLGSSLTLRVLNASGTPLGTGVISASTSTVQVQNLAAGSYYVDVQGAEPADYVLSIASYAQ